MMTAQMAPRFGRLEVNVGLAKANQGYNVLKGADTYGYRMVYNDPSDKTTRDVVTLNGKTLGRLPELNNVWNGEQAAQLMYKLAMGKVQVDTSTADKTPSFSTVFTGLFSSVRNAVSSARPMTVEALWNARKEPLQKRAELAELSYQAAQEIGIGNGTSIYDVGNVVYASLSARETDLKRLAAGQTLGLAILA